MIVSQPSKLKFIPNLTRTVYQVGVGIVDKKTQVGTHIELRTIFGKLIYRLELKGEDLNMERPDAKSGYRFRGQWDYLKIHRNPDPLIDSFKVELHCPNCSDLVYKLTGKLPLIFKIKTNFYVEKDTSKG